MKIRRNILVVLMTLLPCGIAAAADPNDPAQADASSLRRRILHEGIASLPAAQTADPNHARQKDRLWQLIQQVRTLEVPAPAPDPAPAAPAPEPQAAAAAEPAKQPPSTAAPVDAVADPNEDALLSTLRRRPDQILDPASVAEQLYRNRQPLRAAACYKLALDATTRETGGARRAWILYQLGNCLRQARPEEAYKYYEQMVVEYPESPFGPAARAQQQIIAWDRQYKPVELLERYGHDPNSL